MSIMHRMKDECLGAAVLFFASMLVAECTGSLLINVQSPTVEKRVNESLSVACRDNGGQPVTWRGPKGVLGPKTRPMVLVAAHGTAIIINRTRIEDSGLYECRAGGQHKHLNLTVLGTLTIAQPNATRIVNETFFVLCRDGAKRTISWRGPRGPLDAKTRPAVQVALYGTSIVFQNARTEDSGMYTCTAGNEHKKYYLTVQDPVQFMDTNDLQTGVEGNNVLLRCEVKGGKVAWSVEGGDILDTKKYETLADGLLVKNVQRSDSRFYICKGVQQSTGFVRDRKIKLRVLHKPTFPHPLYANEEIAWGYINGTVNLTCMVVADPPAKFEWKKVADRSHKIGKIIAESEDVSVLQLYVDRATFGNYKCVATNPYGKQEKHFSLEEGAKPRAPKFVELRGSNADLLDLGIVPPDAAEGEAPTMRAKGFSVEYRAKVEEGGWEKREFNLTEEHSYVLDNLEQNTEYEVKAATRNVAGLSDFTNSSVFRTLNSAVDVRSSTYFLISAIFALILTDRFGAFTW